MLGSLRSSALPNTFSAFITSSVKIQTESGCKPLKYPNPLSYAEVLGIQLLDTMQIFGPPPTFHSDTSASVATSRRTVCTVKTCVFKTKQTWLVNL